MTAVTHTVRYGDVEIAFNLVKRDRKTLSISVRPNLTIEVVAPIGTPLASILTKVQRRSQWIQRQRRFFAQFLPRTPERQYLSGETHLYLGRQYKLRVRQALNQEVKLKRGELVVQSLRPKQRHLTESLLVAWYRDRAQSTFKKRLAVCRERFANPDEFTPKTLIIRQLDQRWGSMTARGNLVLNRSLVRASVDAIDYVITHELCHLRFPHHGPDFFRLLERVMPDWETRKAKLERQLA